MSMTAQAQFPEETAPIKQRYLMIEGHLSKRSIGLIGKGLPPERPENSAILFVSFANADVPIGRRYKVLFPKDHPELAVATDCEILAVTQEFSKPFEYVPSGWKTICLVGFPTGIPEMVSKLPTIDGWNLDPLLCLCNEETWMVHLNAR